MQLSSPRSLVTHKLRPRLTWLQSHPLLLLSAQRPEHAPHVNALRSTRAWQQCHWLLLLHQGLHKVKMSHHPRSSRPDSSAFGCCCHQHKVSNSQIVRHKLRCVPGSSAVGCCCCTRLPNIAAGSCTQVICAYQNNADLRRVLDKDFTMLQPPQQMGSLVLCRHDKRVHVAEGYGCN